MRTPLLRALFWLTAGILLFAGALTIYAMRLRSLSQKLINSASEIHSTADVERQIAILRNRRGLDFWQDSSAQNGDQTYEVRIENGLLHRLRVVPPTMLGMTIAIHDGNLRYIIVTMFAGRQPSTTSGVWVQEWFGSDSVSAFHVNDNRKPWKATVEFSSAASAAQRGKAFSLNTNCFVKLGGCKSAEEILPGVWLLTSPVSSKLDRQSYP